MKAILPLSALLVATPVLAENAAPSPPEIVAAAPKADWRAIAPADLLVMDLSPRRRGAERRVVIQLMPAPFSQGWVGNIRTLAAARWWDGLSINRVQDNYVVQWGDADGEDPDKARPLPSGLATVPEAAYRLDGDEPQWPRFANLTWPRGTVTHHDTFEKGWPVSAEGSANAVHRWPVHCYGMVGVGRNLSPDTGTGAELYTVIGHAPRHLDGNIALVGRVIEGMEFLTALPRGTGALGFYEKERERVKIVSVRLGNAVKGLPAYEYLATESESFMRYADARANRRDPFFIRPAGGADICNIPVPVRRAK